MNSSMPIQQCMTRTPHTVGDYISLAVAKKIMADFGIRHLPVQNQAKIVGIISERDIHLAYALSPKASELSVKDVMTEQPYCVTGECSVAQVAAEMAKHRYGCAIVENENGRAVGIFTAVDALNLLANDGASAPQTALRMTR